MNDQTDLRAYLAALAAQLIEKIKKEQAYEIRMRHALTKQWSGVGELGWRLADEMTGAAARDRIGWYRIPKAGDSFNAALRDAMEAAGKDVFLGLCSEDADIRKMASDKLSARILEKFEEHRVAVTRRRRGPHSVSSPATVVDLAKRSTRNGS